MSIWNCFKKKKVAEGVTYDMFAKWVDEAMSGTIPENVVAFCFNLYEDTDKKWTLELVGASSFDANDSDWACDEVFATRENPLTWHERAEWPQVLRQSQGLIREYLEKGIHRKTLTACQGLAIGFVDGDLILL